jgi:hypothetical protein
MPARGVAGGAGPGERGRLGRLGLDVEAEAHVVVDELCVQQPVRKQAGGLRIDEDPLLLQDLVALLRSGDDREPQVGSRLAVRLGTHLLGDAKPGGPRQARRADDALDRSGGVFCDR